MSVVMFPGATICAGSSRISKETPWQSAKHTNKVREEGVLTLVMS